MSTATGSPPQKTLPNWDQLTFSLTETDVMFRSCGDKRRDPVWDRGEYVPFTDVRISPAAAFFSYGLGVFEGLKAQRTADGRVLLFRPEENAKRLQRSAERLSMPPFPSDLFVEACVEVVRRNLRFVPPAGKGSFYLRPIQHAIEPKLGLGPSNLFWVIIFGSPVGAYFTAGAPRGVRLQVLEQGRVAPGGTGYAKAMGNYAGGIYVASKWKERGFDDVLYLDARHERFVTETSGSNVFLVRKDGVLVTPPLDDQILPGVTRDSTIQAARKVLGIQVDERPLPVEEVLSEGEELFCTGTAWTLQSVREIVYRERAHAFPAESTRKALLDVIRGIQTGTREDPFRWTREVR
ncbi:MAG: branched-chain-amino-acid transaminase [Planctomycetes bacterium]|nr:branched-chain-amino-acid transaminase [Planctomycetota bacterium]